MRMKPTSRSRIASSFVVLTATLLGGVPAFAAENAAPATTTPIKHVVVIFQENVSFDHYFATYPHAANLKGETRFTPSTGRSPRRSTASTTSCGRRTPTRPPPSASARRRATPATRTTTTPPSSRRSAKGR